MGRAPGESGSGSSFFFFAPLLIPLVILGVPIIDTLFAIIRRARSRSGISNADKGHLHHRLMALGHGHRRSVFILWTWTALLSGFVLWPIYSGSGDGIVPFGIAAILLSLFTILHPGVRLERRRLERDEARDARRRAGLERGGVTGPIDNSIQSEMPDSGPLPNEPTGEEI